MDDKRFDLLTKSLSGGISRRSLLRSLAAAVGVAALGVGQASAAPKEDKGGKKCYGGGSQCTNAKQCCSGTCTNRKCTPEGGGDPCATMNCADANPCTTDGCVAGQCTHTPIAAGTPCAGGFCNSSGTCMPAVCFPGSTEACYSGPAGTEDVGICKAGTRICGDTGQWGSCIGEILPAAEICGNGKDDDCDGVVDDGCPGTECVLPQDCADTDTECRKITCDNGFCGTFNLSGDYSLMHQTAGDCQRNVCDGNGGETTRADDTDLPADDGNECTANLCSNGAPVYPALPLGTACGEAGLGLQCDLKGQCRAGVCTLGTSEACYTGPEGTRGVGVCASGIRTCGPTAEWGSCNGEILPTTEVCGSGRDDNCDGEAAAACAGSECSEPNDCEGPHTECVERTCKDGYCGSVGFCGDCSQRSDCGQQDTECTTVICTEEGHCDYVFAPTTTSCNGGNSFCAAGNCF